MKKTIAILGALLILQLGVAAALRLERPSHEAFQARVPLLTFNASAVDTITISNGDDTTLSLRKQKGTWQLPALGGFPADSAAVQRLLGKLAAMKQGWPVATTAAAAQRFKVAPKSFERRILLSHGGQTLAELYVGTSPGLRKVHVRRPGQQSIYAVAFNTFDAPIKTDDWIDKRVVQTKLEELQRIELPALTLLREKEDWRLPDLGDDEAMAAEEARKLAQQVANITISSVLLKAPAQPGKPLLQYTLTTKSGDRKTFTFYQANGGDGYLLKTSQRPEYFKVPAFYVDNIRDSNRDKLVKKKEAGDGQSTE